MNINYFTFLAASLLLGISSCTDDKPELSNAIEANKSNEKSILSFNTKEELSVSINQTMDTYDTRSTMDLSERKQLSKGQSLYEQDIYKEKLNEIVPNIEFAKLLNKDGEIIVNNTIYKITQYGTYYFDISKKEEFAVLYEKNNFIKGKPIGDKLYLIGNNIYRYDTFHTEESEINSAEKESNIDEIKTKSGSHTGSDPNLDAMDWFTADRTTWFGKIVQNLFGSTKEFSKYYPHTDNRRVKGSFYFYDYVVYAEIGAQGWTDKKNWIGWSKTASDDLRIGWRNVVLITKIPDEYANSLKKMTDLSRSVSPIQYMDVPGTLNKVNMKTMVIPDFDATGFDRVLNTGAPYAFNWLKGLCPQNQSDWEKAEAALIISRTHIFTIFRDQDIRKTNCESYTHVFASQAKFMISVNLASFPQTIADYGKTLANIVQNTSKMSYPTLANGDMYVAAKFGDYWQGMRIKKKQAEIISTMGMN